MKGKIKTRLDTTNATAKKAREEAEDALSQIKRLKELVLHGVIYTLVGIGFFGVLITLFIDQIRKGIYEARAWEWGWIQWVALTVFLGIFMASAILLKFVREK